jgi:hypothetical protein
MARAVEQCAAADPMDELKRNAVQAAVTKAGQPRQSRPGRGRGRAFSPFNNAGQVAYSFVLADGRAGVAA